MADDFIPYTFDDDIITLAKNTREPQLKIYRLSEIAVVIGKGGKAAKELNIPAIIEDGRIIYRRYGGGCSVVIDPGNVIVAVVIPTDGIASNRKYFHLLTDWIIGGLKKMGLSEAETAGTSDIALAGKKISGSCIYSTKYFLYYSATLLLEPQMELMQRYLKHPPREPGYRSGRKHADFIASVGDFNEIGGLQSFTDRIRHTLNLESLKTVLPHV